MKKRMIGSVVAAAILATGLHADDALIQRFEKMEKEMAALKAELEALKAENAQLSTHLATPAPAETKTEVGFRVQTERNAGRHPGSAERDQ